MTRQPLFADILELKADSPELFREAPEKRKDEPMTVSELSYALKSTVENGFSSVRVRGEISGFKKAASGHMYFALKDEESVLDGVCWRGGASRLSVVPEDGLEVVCTGRITTYPGRSKYQMVVETMEAAGEGALLKLLEERRKKLEAEGLFAPERKKKIPFLPDVIGVVTSPTGAVIRDIMHRLNDRFPRRVLLWPCVVQGEDAAAQVAAAVRGFNAIPRGGKDSPDGKIPRPDVLIVARGGGSLEDLWAFNEEIVVRAVAASDIPVISAVGHETDTTLIDYASDLRAPTPTGAAEKAVPVRSELIAGLTAQNSRAYVAVSRLLSEKRNILTGLRRGLPPLEQITDEYAQKLDDRTERLQNAAAVFFKAGESALKVLVSRLIRPDLMLANAQNALLRFAQPLNTSAAAAVSDAAARFETAARLLESFSYERILDRGFALVLDDGGKPVVSAKSAAKHPDLNLKFADGSVSVTTASAQKTPQKRARPAKTADNDKQGTLL